MTRSDGSEGIIQIEHSTDEGTVEKDTWLVVRKHLHNASQVWVNNVREFYYLTKRLHWIFYQTKTEKELLAVLYAKD